MPKTTHITNSSNADQRLSDLLRLKRLEQPDPAFWSAFEQEFRSRQLSTFVRAQPLRARVLRASILVLRKAGPTAAATGAIALTVFAASNTAYLANSTDPHIQSELVPPASEEKPSSENFFVVAESFSDSSEGTTAAAETSLGTIYQTNPLRLRSNTEAAYQLQATPVTFSNGTVEQTIGAKIISATPGY